MIFDPERDGWRLDEAIMRLSDPAELAAIARLGRLAEEQLGEPAPLAWTGS